MAGKKPTNKEIVAKVEALTRINNIAIEMIENIGQSLKQYLEFKGDVKDVIRELHVGIRSGLSYSGSRCIQELQNRAVFLRQTTSGQAESSTHIMGR